ncbi:type I-E CRISPR-associated protein Cse2/CasB [Streptomyces sp. UNOC14_S4]|uniref:type I-E CRISPR-associated protein Cse2/CasB n=1 Tax=Streptomyces sp. UNOC14_S4 TaxID=2872340 RepID=UPI001E52B539|nr:type I-E CRISPR-associated protein Cse2/CasB [Streptomyces sp. UNOC14_S4]MCC3768635.1 type I-E CRISPR-associated protein Cse2/CasB [Streptomyces sp. UNOC14_S4]
MRPTSEDLGAPRPGTAPPLTPRHEKLKTYDTFVACVRQACERPGTQQALRAGLARPVDEVPARTHAALLRHGLVPDRSDTTVKRAYYAVAALIAARPRAERRADADARRAADAGDKGDKSGTGATGPGADPASPAEQSESSEAEAQAQQFSWGTSLGESLAQLTVRRERATAPGTGGTQETSADTCKSEDRVSGVEQRLHLLVRQDIEGLHRMLPAVVRQLGSAGVPVDYGRLLRDLVRWPRRRDETVRRWLEDYYRTLRLAKPPA